MITIKIQKLKYGFNRKTEQLLAGSLMTGERGRMTIFKRLDYKINGNQGFPC